MSGGGTEAVRRNPPPRLQAVLQRSGCVLRFGKQCLPTAARLNGPCAAHRLRVTFADGR